MSIQFKNQAYIEANLLSPYKNSRIERANKKIKMLHRVPIVIVPLTTSTINKCQKKLANIG